MSGRPSDAIQESAPLKDGQVVFAHNLRMSFGATTVLEGLSLTIPAGQKVAIIGPSGAGKTTLLRIMAGVLPVSSGELRIFAQSPNALSPRKLARLRRRIGKLYQSDNLIPGLRVAHNVNVGRLPRWSLFRAVLSLLVPQGLTEVRQALRKVELEDKLWALPGTLSGGQQQRVAIARLLLQNPELILADEPVSGLDNRLGREVIEILVGIARERGATLVVSLHTLEMLGNRFDRIIAIRAGRLVWDGVPEDLDQAVLLEVYGAEYQTLHLSEFAAEP